MPYYYNDNDSSESCCESSSSEFSCEPTPSPSCPPSTSCNPCKPKPCKKSCPKNNTKVSAILMNGLSGKGTFPPGEHTDGFYYLDICTGISYVASGSVESGWLPTPPPPECTHYYFNDTTNKVIWKVSRKKDKKDKTAVYSVLNTATVYCNGDIFVDTNTKKWYLLTDCKWVEKLDCDGAWFNSVDRTLIPTAKEPDWLNYDELLNTTSYNLNFVKVDDSTAKYFSVTEDGSYNISLSASVETTELTSAAVVEFVVLKRATLVTDNELLFASEGTLYFDDNIGIEPQPKAFVASFNVALLTTDLVSARLVRSVYSLSEDVTMTCKTLSVHKIASYADVSADNSNQ